LDSYHPKGVTITQLSLVKTACLVRVALSTAVWDTPLRPSEHLWSWRVVRVLLSTGPDHLSQGVRHFAEDCVALGW
jgi:hypothetical protein